jgi:hypothetical protein
MPTGHETEIELVEIQVLDIGCKDTVEKLAKMSFHASVATERAYTHRVQDFSQGIRPPHLAADLMVCREGESVTSCWVLDNDNDSG